ncbi:copper ion binding protein, partial [Faecalibacillus intestinalis]|uniref:copper ion binding protein n=1 Tax=Faecalibacillus intestinalis TaxID=1982626 RepID=UPI00399ACFDF
MKRIFLLKGLDCPNCSAKIEKEVGELDGVQSSVVNLMKQTLTINVAQTAADTIASQIETIVHSHEPDVEVQEETVMNVTKSYSLKGLDCPNCSAKIEKEVGELDGVQSSVVNLMKQTLTINVAQTAADTIASQIETIVHSHEPDVEVQEETVMNVTKSYSLKGLDCPNCSAKIEKEVGELDGVQSSVVNLMKQTLTINVAPVAANTIASQIETIVHSHEPDVEVSEIAQEYYIPAKKQDTNTSYNNEDKKLTIRLAIGAA